MARLLPPVETALIGALDAPLAPLWVWTVFAETPGAGTVGGGLMVFAAVTVHIGLATWQSAGLQGGCAAGSSLRELSG